jgi:glycosyltransferase involved in cell wall biosynthesis
MYLDREFTRQGYNSLVAATGDSKVYGTLVETIPESLSLFTMNGEKDNLVRPRKRHDELAEEHYSIILKYILENKIDVIHDHPGSGILISKKFKKVTSNLKTPLLVTLHGAFSEDYQERYNAWNLAAKENGNVYFNAISQNQKKSFEEKGFNVEEMIYHGIPLDTFEFQENKLNYLFSLGRICPKKGQHLAVKVARETGIPLIIAGEVNSAHHNYWKETIEPYLTFSVTKIPETKQEDYKNSLINKLNSGKEIISKKEIIFIGNLTDQQKIPFYKNAKSFIMPIQWQEPFGLTLIESMACGTPVIATDFGSVPEIIKNDKTGMIVKKTENEKDILKLIIEATEKIKNIKPLDCRNHIEENFSIEKEARNYLELYQRIIRA